MASGPNLRLDIDALFAHLTNNLGYEAGMEKQWDFSIRSTPGEFGKLRRLAETLEDEFDVMVQKEVPTVDEGGREFMGPPILAIGATGALGPAEVKALAARFEAAATAAGLRYEGVSCYEPDDMEEMFGWLDLEGAVWRLRHFTDNGVAPGEEVGYVFAVATEEPEGLEALGGAFAAEGYSDLELVEDEEGNPFLLVHVDGRNDEDLLKKCYGAMEGIAGEAGGELLGVQFQGEEDEEGEEGDEE